MTDRATCETCRFADGPVLIQVEPDRKALCCKRMPPTAIPVGDDRDSRQLGQLGLWPLVTRTSWCGEHQRTNDHD